MSWTTKVITTEKIEETIKEVSKFLFCGLKKETAEHFSEHHKGDSTTILGYSEGRLVGLLTIRWKANYQPFKTNKIPLIHYIEIVYQHQNKGFGTKLMNEAEQIIKQQSRQAGICVNISQEFGVAMRMYAKRGYLFDGNGATVGVKAISAGQIIENIDDVFVWMIKSL